MYLTERLIGVTIYASLLFMVCYLLYRSRPNDIKYILAFYLLCICGIAFLYIPAAEADLYRLIEYMFNYAALSRDDFRVALFNPTESGAPASMIYLRAIGLTGIAGLLAGLTTLIVFGNIFYIIYNFSKNLPSPNKAIAFTLFVIMSNGIYMQTVSGIRNMLAFSILAKCFYDEIQNDKDVWKNAIWYTLACLLHPAAIGAVLIRLVVLIHDKFSRGMIRSLIITTLTLSLIAYLILYFGGAAYFDSAFEKIASYTSEIGYTYFWNNLIAVLTILFIAINYKLYKISNKRPYDSKISSLIKLSYMLTVMCLIFMFEHTIFVRFTALNLIIMIPVIMSNISSITSSTGKAMHSHNFLIRLSFYIPIIVFCISVTRGALSSLKFFIID